MQKRESQAFRPEKYAAKCPSSGKCKKRENGDCTTGTTAKHDCLVCGGNQLEVEYLEGRGLYIAGCICNNCPKFLSGKGFFVPDTKRRITTIYHRGCIITNRDAELFDSYVQKLTQNRYYSVLQSNQEGTL